MEIITVLFCPPGQKPKLMQIQNDVQALEEVLEGTLGIKVLGEDGICLLYNDIGDKKALDLNRVIQAEPIFGSCIFCRKKEDKLHSLTEEEIKDLEHLLA